MRISVITPGFNQAAFLEQAMLSVLDQDWPDIEYIVLDGGSGDGSADIIRKYEGRLARWRSSPDAGQSAAINEGLRAVTGQIVGWLNSDDLLLPGALRRIASAFEDPAVRAVCGWTLTIDQDSKIVSRRVFPQPTADVLLRRSILSQPAVWWRRELIESVGLLDESLKVCMDLDYWVRLARAGVVPRLIPAYLAAFRRHADQKTAGRSEIWRREESAIWQRLHGPAADRKKLRKSVSLPWRARYNVLKHLANIGLTCRIPEDARKALMK
ncbi:MAG: glycosyltransferase [Planctomycetes bacterium]|nr:glycosyltransferase [Planctomycetota bacterium]